MSATPPPSGSPGPVTISLEPHAPVPEATVSLVPSKPVVTAYLRPQEDPLLMRADAIEEDADPVILEARQLDDLPDTWEDYSFGLCAKGGMSTSELRCSHSDRTDAKREEIKAKEAFLTPILRRGGFADQKLEQGLLQHLGYQSLDEIPPGERPKFVEFNPATNELTLEFPRKVDGTPPTFIPVELSFFMNDDIPGVQEIREYLGVHTVYSGSVMYQNEAHLRPTNTRKSAIEGGSLTERLQKVRMVPTDQRSLRATWEEFKVRVLPQFIKGVSPEREKEIRLRLEHAENTQTALLIRVNVIIGRRKKELSDNPHYPESLVRHKKKELQELQDAKNKLEHLDVFAMGHALVHPHWEPSQPRGGEDRSEYAKEREAELLGYIEKQGGNVPHQHDMVPYTFTEFRAKHGLHFSDHEKREEEHDYAKDVVQLGNMVRSSIFDAYDGEPPRSTVEELIVRHTLWAFGYTQKSPLHTGDRKGVGLLGLSGSPEKELLDTFAEVDESGQLHGTGTFDGQRLRDEDAEPFIRKQSSSVAPVPPVSPRALSTPPSSPRSAATTDSIAPSGSPPKTAAPSSPKSTATTDSIVSSSSKPKAAVPASSSLPQAAHDPAIDPSQPVGDSGFVVDYLSGINEDGFFPSKTKRSDLFYQTRRSARREADPVA